MSKRGKQAKAAAVAGAVATVGFACGYLAGAALAQGRLDPVLARKGTYTSGKRRIQLLEDLRVGASAEATTNLFNQAATWTQLPGVAVSSDDRDAPAVISFDDESAKLAVHVHDSPKALLGRWTLLQLWEGGLWTPGIMQESVVPVTGKVVATTVHRLQTDDG